MFSCDSWSCVFSWVFPRLLFEALGSVCAAFVLKYFPRDEARRIAAKVAKLPGLLKRPLLNTNACFLSQRDYLSATSLPFSNAGSSFSQAFETDRIAEVQDVEM